jgi:hypothetical protein
VSEHRTTEYKTLRAQKVTCLLGDTASLCALYDVCLRGKTTHDRNTVKKEITTMHELRAGGAPVLGSLARRRHGVTRDDHSAQENNAIHPDISKTLQ